MEGYGQTASTYALRATYTQCPSDFTNDGKQMMCSSLVDAPESEKRYTGCSAEGVCECKAPYQKPLPQVYDGKYLHSLCAATCTSACPPFVLDFPILPKIAFHLPCTRQTIADSLARSITACHIPHLHSAQICVPKPLMTQANKSNHYILLLLSILTCSPAYADVLSDMCTKLKPRPTAISSLSARPHAHAHAHGLNQGLHAGLGFAECSARVTTVADDDLSVEKAYLREHEQVQTRGWVYYAFNVTDQDYQVVVNVAEEEGSQCKLLHHLPVSPADLYTDMYACLCIWL